MRKSRPECHARHVCVQILLTYITAFLFFQEEAIDDNSELGVEHSDQMGFLLVGLNSISFLVMGCSTIFSVLQQQAKQAAGQLRIQFRGAKNKPKSFLQGACLAVSLKGIAERTHRLGAQGRTQSAP